MFGQKIDYVVRNRIRDSRKAEIWAKDQYYNPHETWHSVDEVLAWFRENGVSYLTCIPRIIGAKPVDTDRHNDGLPEKGDAGSKVGRIVTQFSWLGSTSAEGALFVMLGRRNP
jgi:hypothetical protein